MVPWSLGDCCTPCSAASSGRTSINSVQDQPRRRSKEVDRAKFPLQAQTSVNIGIGFAAQEKLQLTPRNGAPLSPAPADKQPPGSAALSGAGKVSPVGSVAQSDNSVPVDVELWAMPFQRVRRKRGDGLKGWALIRAKRKSMVVLHRLLAEQKQQGDMSYFFSPRAGGSSPHPSNGSSPRGDGSARGPRTKGSKGQSGSLLTPPKAPGSGGQNSSKADSLTIPTSPVSPTPQSPSRPPSSKESKGAAGGLKRQNSQADFAKPWQTIIVFDWDDTLFPTTYVRDDLNMSWRKPVEQQDFPKDQKKEIIGHLERCEKHAICLLQMAVTLGKVVLVTLARAPWVTECCRHFYPKMGKIVNDLKVPIIYAQEGTQVDYDKQKMMSSDDVEIFWATVKGKAIAKEIAKFYTQYVGQSWKNILSIGDSDFERLGTFQATEQYVKFSKVDTSGDRNLDLNEMKAFLKKSRADISDSEVQSLFVGMDANNDGLIDFNEFLEFIYSKNGERAMSLLGVGVEKLTHERDRKVLHEVADGEGRVFKVRTKSLKIMDEPTAEEMEAQLPMMLRWLPPMVFLDNGCDFALEGLDSMSGVKKIEDTLRNVRVVINDVAMPTKSSLLAPPAAPLSPLSPGSNGALPRSMSLDDCPTPTTRNNSKTKTSLAKWLGAAKQAVAG